MDIKLFGLKWASKAHVDGASKAAIANGVAEPGLDPAPMQATADALAATPSPLPPANAAPQTLATREDVVAAYKIFLNRLPESEEVITARIGAPRERILSSFLTSKYFVAQPENIALIRRVAQQIESRAQP